VPVKIEYEVSTWQIIYEMLIAQTQKIQASQYQPNIIIGIAKGGTIPTRILSDLMEISQTTNIQIKSYRTIAEPEIEPLITQRLTTSITNKKVLLVDDIADSGKTLKAAKMYLQEHKAKDIKIATLYAKPTSEIEPDFYEKKTSKWVVFPWEMKETLRKIIQKSKDKQATNEEVEKLVRSGLPKQIVEKILKTMEKP
jgi:hypoxanthine phosphoribosyltransferase